MKSEIMKFRYTQFIRAYFEGKTKEQIMKEINISSATYYRYRNMYLKCVTITDSSNDEFIIKSIKDEVNNIGFGYLEGTNIESTSYCQLTKK